MKANLVFHPVHPAHGFRGSKNSRQSLYDLLLLAAALVMIFLHAT